MAKEADPKKAGKAVSSALKELAQLEADVSEMKKQIAKIRKTLEDSTIEYA